MGSGSRVAALLQISWGVGEEAADAVHAADAEDAAEHEWALLVSCCWPDETNSTSDESKSETPKNLNSLRRGPVSRGGKVSFVGDGSLAFEKQLAATRVENYWRQAGGGTKEPLLGSE